jgi:hypothetical protein
LLSSRAVSEREASELVDQKRAGVASENREITFSPARLTSLETSFSHQQLRDKVREPRRREHPTPLSQVGQIQERWNDGVFFSHFLAQQKCSTLILVDAAAFLGSTSVLKNGRASQLQTKPAPSWSLHAIPRVRPSAIVSLRGEGATLSGEQWVHPTRESATCRSSRDEIVSARASSSAFLIRGVLAG